MTEIRSKAGRFIALWLLVACGVACSDATWYVNSATQAYDSEEFGIAASYFDKAAGLTDNPALLYNASVSHWKQGQKEDDKRSAAIEFIEETLGRDDLSAVQLTKLQYMAGDLLIADNREDEARPLLEQASRETDDQSSYLPALHALVTLDAQGSTDSKTRLLLAIVETEGPEIDREQSLN